MSGKAIECVAAICWEPKADLVLEKVIVQPPQANEVRIKILYTGICFSDVHVNDGHLEGVEFPIISGHESIAEVESVGSGVSTVKPGDIVVPIWCLECGECSTCSKKFLKRNACERILSHGIRGRLLDGTKRVSCKGKDVGSFCFVGSFSQYTVVPEVGVTKLKPGINLEKLAPFGCCVPTGYGAAINAAKVQPGSTVAIWGLGAVGLCTVLGARDAKATRIIGIDLNSDKFEMAEKFGCTRTINPRDFPGRNIQEILGDLTGLGGVDYAFVCVGVKAAAAEAMQCCSFNGGVCTIVGLVDDSLDINPLDVIFGKTLIGTWGGDCHFREDIPKLVDLYLAGNFPTDDLVTHTMPFEKINEGLELLKKGKSIRTILKF